MAVRGVKTPSGVYLKHKKAKKKVMQAGDMQATVQIAERKLFPPAVKKMFDTHQTPHIFFKSVQAIFPYTHIPTMYVVPPLTERNSND